jgi:glycosyltransferase involved in cell wall biosynthesis
MDIEFSIIIPVYKNAESLPQLLIELAKLEDKLPGALEAVFVVDGCPQGSYAILKKLLSNQNFSSQLLLHSRNFGSFAAIRAGLISAKGKYSAVMAADLQEPPSLAYEMLLTLKTEDVDIVVGCRLKRDDPLLSSIASSIFWWLYRKLVIRDIPKGGVDMFGCNLQFREALATLNEQHTSLIGLIYWLGFTRKEISYSRLERPHGKSAWTLSKKINYLLDSIFAFSDLPIKTLFTAGILGVSVSFLLAIIILCAKLFGAIQVPGYAATILTITFFGAFNSLGLGIIGSYVWRAYGNTQKRPNSVIQTSEYFSAMGKNNEK